MIENYILNITIFLPLLGAFILLLFDTKKENTLKYIALMTSLLTFIVSLILYFKFNTKSYDFQFVYTIPWIAQYNIRYSVGIDGLSLLMILLTTFLTPITLLSSWNSIKDKLKEFLIFFLILETGMIGVFAALDMFLFYIFWEAMLIPMYFIIGIWGGKRRIYASVKFFIYTMFGSVLMLVAIIVLGFYSKTNLGGFTTDFITLSKIAPSLPLATQTFMFLAFGISFAIKVPLFPFHTWLPDAHVEAPTAGSVILAGVLLKMGTYGLLRFNVPMFPDATKELASVISVLAIIGIIYGALVAMVQTDVKKLIAYSSVSHLGFVVLGIFALNQESVQGAILQMVNHGISTGALFILVGMLYDRRHTREISEFGGLAKVVPVFSSALLIASLSSIGLPLLNGFVGEFLILTGTFKSQVLNSWWFTVFAATGVILSAVYLLWMYQRVIYGNLENPKNKELKDLDKREIGLLIPLLILAVWIGIYPSTFLRVTTKTVDRLIENVFIQNRTQTPLNLGN